MVGQRKALDIDEIADRLRRGSVCDLDVFASEPIEPRRDAAANATHRPENKRHTPLRHPVAQICIFFDAVDVVVQSSDTDLIEAFVIETARFEFAKSLAAPGPIF